MHDVLQNYVTMKVIVITISVNQYQSTGVCGGIYYEGIYMVKVILAEIYMLEHFL